MPLLKGAGSSCGTTNTIKLYLFLLTLTLLSFVYHGFFPMSLDNTNFRVYHVFSFLARKAQLGQPTIEEASLSLKEPRTTPQPVTISTGKPQKTLHVYEYIINEPNKCQGDVPFLVLLIAVERWQKEARQAIRQAWGKEDFVPGVRIVRLFVLGKDAKWTNDTQASLLKESEEYHDIIQQDYMDTYRNLTTKVLMGFNWVATYCPDAFYVMKTDSDMFVNTEYLINSILKPDQPPKLNYFTGHLMRNSPPIRDKKSKWSATVEEYPGDRYPMFCSGTGYVFSADLASKIVNISPTVRWLHLEDVYVGLCLNKLGIEPVAPPNGSDFNNWRVQYSDCKYNQIVTSHWVNPGEIIRFWNRLQQNKHSCQKR